MANLDLEAAFAKILEAWVPPGQASLAQAARRLSERWVNIDTTISNDAFLEPLVVAWLTSPARRPALHSLLLPTLVFDQRAQEVSTIADLDGIVELPGLGTFAGNVPGEELELCWLGSDRVYVRSSAGGFGREVILRPLPVVPGTRAVLARCAHPLLERFYTDADGHRLVVETSAASRNHAGDIARAFTLLECCVPLLHAHLAVAVRRVTVHQAGAVNSFATPAAHGAVFLAAAADDSEVGLAEDLVHQGGHVLCTAIMADPSAFFKIPQDTPLSAITGASPERETRSLNEALHGFFTEAAMILFLHRLLDLEGLTARQAHEALGRLAYISSRAASDLAELSKQGLFTENGLGILQLCSSALAETIKSRRAQLMPLDLSDQPYAFSYGIFTAHNPLVGRPTLAG